MTLGIHHHYRGRAHLFDEVAEVYQPYDFREKVANGLRNFNIRYTPSPRIIRFIDFSKDAQICANLRNFNQKASQTVRNPVL